MIEPRMNANRRELKIPELRFPEFDGKWVEKRLEEVAKIKRGRFSPRPRNNPIYYNGDVPFVQTSDVVNSRGKIAEYSQTLNEKGVRVSKVFERGTVLLTIAANIGHSGVLQIDMACPDSLVGLIPSDQTNSEFLNYYLSTQQSRMERLAPEAAQKNINIEFLKPYPAPLPTLPEQKKIASFLSSVDGRIEGLEKRGALLRDYKKGLMQKLFNQSLRFNDDCGNPFPDWVEKTFAMIAERAKEKLDPTTGENCPCVELESLSQQTGALIKTLDSENLKSLKTRFVSGDVLFGKLRPYLKKFLLTNFDGVCSSEIWVLRGLAVSNEFLYFLIQTQKFSDEVNSTTGSKMPRAEWKYIAGVKFEIPSLAEQRKIADCLSAVDRRIGSVEAQVAQTRAFKQGLLQQMFV